MPLSAYLMTDLRLLMSLCLLVDLMLHVLSCKCTINFKSYAKNFFLINLNTFLHNYTCIIEINSFSLESTLFLNFVKFYYWISK